MKLAKVSVCDCTACAFNEKKKCFATAITVGGPEGPLCDTFVRSSIKCGLGETTGTVSVCKVSGCRYNDCLECSAEKIRIQDNGSLAECGTYKPWNS